MSDVVYGGGAGLGSVLKCQVFVAGHPLSLMLSSTLTPICR